MNKESLVYQPRWHRLICILNHRGSWRRISLPAVGGAIDLHDTGCSRCSTIWCSHIRAYYDKEYWEQ